MPENYTGWTHVEEWLNLEGMYSVKIAVGSVHSGEKRDKSQTTADSIFNLEAQYGDAGASQDNK